MSTSPASATKVRNQLSRALLAAGFKCHNRAKAAWESNPFEAIQHLEVAVEVATEQNYQKLEQLISEFASPAGCAVLLGQRYQAMTKKWMSTIVVTGPKKAKTRTIPYYD